MKSVVLSVALLLSGCLSYSYNNLHVYNWSNAETEDLARVVRYSVNKTGYPNMFKGWKVIFSDSYPEVVDLGNGKVAVTDGITDMFTETITTKVHSCEWDSALLHELYHVVQIKVYGHFDYKHKDRKIWGKVEELEKQMLERCPVGYKREM